MATSQPPKEAAANITSAMSSSPQQLPVSEQEIAANPMPGTESQKIEGQVATGSQGPAVEPAEQGEDQTDDSSAERYRLRKDSLVLAHESESRTQVVSEPITRVIMIAIDDSKFSSKALEWADKNIINETTDLAILVNVRDYPPMPTYGTSLAFEYEFVIPKLEDQNRTASHALLKDAAAKLRRNHRQLACKAISIRGEPREELVRKSTEVHADVLVVGSQGRGFLKRALLGSVSDYLVHHAKCSVIVVKPTSNP